MKERDRRIGAGGLKRRLRGKADLMTQRPYHLQIKTNFLGKRTHSSVRQPHTDASSVAISNAAVGFIVVRASDDVAFMNLAAIASLALLVFQYREP